MDSDKIRILLVDDEPGFALGDSTKRYPILPARWRRHFELKWLQNAHEVRTVLNGFYLLQLEGEESCMDVDLPPEILVFDYAMEGKRYQRPAGDATDVATTVSNYFSESGLTFPVKDSPAPITATQPSADRTGLYMGVALARLFGAHPCGAVPTTAKITEEALRNTEAAFYEWLNEDYFLKLFDFKFRGDPSWDELIVLGLKAMRERMTQLAKAGLLELPIALLLQLENEPDAARKTVLRLKGRHGSRSFLIEALFADVIPGDVFSADQLETTEEVSKGDTTVEYASATVKAAEYGKTASGWAKDILDALFGSTGHTEFQQSRKLAEHYCRLATSREATVRERASEGVWNLAEPDDSDAVSAIAAGYGLSLRRTSKKWLVKTNFEAPLDAAAGDPIVARWAILMLMVLLEKVNKSVASETATALGGVGGVRCLPATVQREQLVRKLGGEEQLEVYLSRWRRWGATSDGNIIVLPTERTVGLEDVLHAIDPKPEQLLYYWHRDPKTKKEIHGAETDIAKRLQKLGQKHSASAAGPFYLSVSDVLQRKDFDCPICNQALLKGEDPGRHRNSGAKQHHGLRKGERRILQMYAEEKNFSRRDWPAWLI